MEGPTHHYALGVGHHADTIKKIADEEPCVMVGRCADYALEEFDNVVNP